LNLKISKSPTAQLFDIVSLSLIWRKKKALQVY